MADVSYRLLGSGDVAAYRAIRLQCLKENPTAFGSDYDDERKKEKLFFEEVIEAHQTDDFMMGAFLGTSLIGICGHVREKKKKTAHVGMLIQIYTSPAHQGKGIGQALIKNTVAHAFYTIGVEVVILGVISDNRKAISVYEQIGFREYGRLDGFLRYEGQAYDEILMEMRREAADLR